MEKVALLESKILKVMSRSSQVIQGHMKQKKLIIIFMKVEDIL